MLGILSFFCGGIITGVIGLILGIIGKKRAREFGASTQMAQAGIILSIIATVLYLLLIVGIIISFVYYDSWY